MKTVAIVSPVGGAGRTTLTAALAGLVAARKRPALALECDPRNVLALHFGLREPARAGLVSYLRDPAGAPGAALRTDDNVLLVPWGTPGDGDSAPGASARAAAAIAAQLHAQPDWLRALLARIDLPASAIALVDTPTWPSAETDQALAAADLVLVVLPPEPLACATLPRLSDALARRGVPCFYIANAVLPSRPLHTDIVALLRASLGEAMLPYQIHADAGVPEALARGENFCASAPGSQAAHDLQGLATWVVNWTAAAMPANPGAPR